MFNNKKPLPTHTSYIQPFSSEHLTEDSTQTWNPDSFSTMEAIVLALAPLFHPRYMAPTFTAAAARLYLNACSHSTGFVELNRSCHLRIYQGTFHDILTRYILQWSFRFKCTTFPLLTPPHKCDVCTKSLHHCKFYSVGYTCSHTSHFVSPLSENRRPDERALFDPLAKVVRAGSVNLISPRLLRA